MKQPSVAIVIPVYNAEKTIAASVEGALAQDYLGPLEVIVVDDGSTDRSAEILKQFPALKIFQQTNSGPAVARNQGAQMAQSEIIFFTDSDCVPEKNWVSTQLPFWNEEKIGAVAGSYGIANPQSRLAYFIQAEILYRHRVRMPEYPKVFGSYNFSMPRKLFWELGGFNTGYRFASGEDNDLSYKINQAGYRIHFAKESIVNHYHTESLRKYLHEQYRHGFWRVKMYREHPEMMKGDGYTFWKDPMEVLLVFMFLLFPICLSLQWVALSALCFGSAFFLYVLEFFFALRMTKHLSEKLFFSNVMFLRSFFRTFGFSSGILHFLAKKN